MSIQSTITFTVGPRVIFVAYDYSLRRRRQYERQFPRPRITIRAMTQNGVRVNRNVNPELWNELRQDLLIALEAGNPNF